MRKIFKLKKIEIFLIMGFIISFYSFSMLIGYCSNSASEIIERNRFHRRYKDVEIAINNLEELESIEQMIDNIYDLGIRKFTSKYLTSAQEPVKESQENVLRNEVLGAYGSFDMGEYCEIEGRNFTSEETMSNEKIAIIGERVNDYIYEINNEKYIKLFNDDYKVIGILKNTKNFSRTTIIPFKSLNFINNNYDKFGFLVSKDEYKKLEELSKEKYSTEINAMPTKFIVSYLYQIEDVFRECIFQLILSLANLILFSVFIASDMKKDISIMKVLGCTNRDVFKEIIKKNIKVATIGNLIGIVLFKISSSIIDVAFVSKIGNTFTTNMIITSIICYCISILISIATLKNILKFKVIKEIR
ncbi:MacB-like core domain-containing protein [Clostridium sp. DSM 8431]|uniref:ABC transporter permease n=1 Tax=Clostridium sp. DSM 8431 TaxID=1761781 RepID=UPI0008E2A7C1|nr:ABC transporter permease [Clostridium sp. DSM 8431]SFU75391.1 MacB-like core domain-containing protein [Clostridium sp. DSM 8431]